MKETLFIGFLCVILLMSLTIVSAEKNMDEVVQNLVIEVDGTDVLRSGDEIIVRTIVKNLNNDTQIILDSIDILNSKNKLIKASNENKLIKPIKQDVTRLNELNSLRYNKLSTLEIEKEYYEKAIKIKNETFSKGFLLNIHDFDSNPQIGENVTIPIKLRFNYEGKDYVVEKIHTILVSEPLPSPPHNSPGWYAGNNHVHSKWSIDSSTPISEMVVEAKAENLEWVIFTDHSDYMDSSDWSDARDECDDEDISSFECVYGQELALDAPGMGCDRRHYLAYDATPSYIDAQCVCWCEDAEEKIVELTNNGGYGFVAHPHDSVTGWDDWSVTGFTGLEIINAEVSNDDLITINNPGGDDDSWREFLQSETNPDNGFVVGIADSDAHSIAGLGDTFTYCYLNSLSQTNAVNAIKNGNCVASTGPFVEFTLDGNIIGSVVNAMSGTNTLDISANSEGFGNLQWLYIYVNDQLEDYVQLSGTSYSDSIDINLDTSDDYIRLEVYTDTGRRAYTNPIWVDVTSCTCGSWTEGSCGGGSCNSDQLQSTRTCTPSACASETKCEYDEECEEGGEVTECEEYGYEFCIEAEYEYCDVSIAENLYENVNNIEWGAVNDAWDPYVIGEYTIGWKDVDAEQMYYDCNGNDDCYYGGCDCDEINDEDTMVTVTAPGTAHRDEILGYDDTPEEACTIWWYPFNPNYGANNPIYVLNCFDDGDCASNKYCDKSSSWSNWNCANDFSNGQSCTRDAQCSSGYCDDDGVGLGDDAWCFSPYNTYFDGQENSYCEYSTDYGNLNCDERQVGSDLNLCVGISYYEEECSNNCQYQDITSIFECSEAGCSCSEFLCDGLTTGSNITTCSSNQTYFADKCTSTAGGEDRGDNICRNSTFASGCTADPECGGIVAGTGSCDSSCNFILPDIHKFYIRNSSGSAVAWLGNEGNIILKGNCFSGGNCDSPGADSFIIRNITNNNVAFINSTGDLCVETGNCSDQSVTCNTSPENAFIVKDSSNDNVIYIDKYGDLCLIGQLYENSEP